MKLSTKVALIAWAILLVLAFVAAPHSCEWGLSAYTWTGVTLLVGLPIVALMMPLEERGGRPALRVLATVAGTIVIWVAGLFLANVRIMCRLF